MSLIRFLSAEHTATRLEILMDYHRSVIEVHYTNADLVTETSSFDLVGTHNTWISFVITLRQEESVITLLSEVWPKQERVIPAGISLRFTENTEIAIGGTSTNAQTPFAVSRHFVW